MSPLSFREKQAQGFEREAHRRDRRAALSTASAVLMYARAALERATEAQDRTLGMTEHDRLEPTAERAAVLDAHKKWGAARMACARDDVIADLERLGDNYGLSVDLDAMADELREELRILADAVDELEAEAGR